MDRTIEIARYEEADMAYILLDGEAVFIGNEWDFHAGCMGTTIAGYDLEGKWDKGVESLAYVLSVEIEREGATVTRSERTLTEHESDVISYGKAGADRIAAENESYRLEEAEAATNLAPAAAPYVHDHLALTGEQIEAIGERECDLCGEEIDPARWCAGCSAIHDESRCPRCCSCGEVLQKRSLIAWLRENGLWPK